MNKIKNLADLRKIKEGMQGRMSMREKSDSSEAIIQIRVGMATSGIASGAKETMNYLITELDKRQIKALVMQVATPRWAVRWPITAQSPRAAPSSLSPTSRRTRAASISTTDG